MSKMSTTFRSVSYRSCSFTGVRFRWDNLVVDGRQMVSLVGALCLIYIASFTFLLCHLDSQVNILCSSWILNIMWPGNGLLLLLVYPGLCVL